MKEKITIKIRDQDGQWWLVKVENSASDLARGTECGAAIEISRLQVASTFQIGTMAFPRGWDQ